MRPWKRQWDYLLAVGSYLGLAAPAQAQVQAAVKLTRTGHVPADSLYKLFYVPIEVPTGTREIRVQESYAHQGKNVLIGICDPRGHQPGSPQGFREWSGGAKNEFFLNAQAASTDYVPGPVGAGT